MKQLEKIQENKQVYQGMVGSKYFFVEGALLPFHVRSEFTLKVIAMEISNSSGN